MHRNDVRKLHIGCGANILDQWLNADYKPRFENVLQLDATQQFPIGDNEFDYIFSEHMIEHISYLQGLSMLMEFYRILRKGGRVRISTPDLLFLVNLYKENKSDLQKEYIKWATDHFIEDAPAYEDAFVINNFVRDWGHQFIYDEKTLRSSLKKSGFSKIEKYSLNNSDDELLANLENEKRLPEGFLRLETFTLEAEK